MTTELAPQFAVTVRGYDRAQVDDYVDTLREWLGNATLRMEAAESESSQLREQVMLFRTRLAQLDQQLSANPPRTIEALGDRVARILLLAEEGALSVQADAEAEAVSIIGRARQEAADLVRAAQSRQTEMEAFIAGAGEQAAALVREAETRGAEAASRLLAEAETRAAGREAESAERARILVADAEAQRDRILAQLHDEERVLGADLQRLTTERNEVRDGLTRLRESLHRTISEVSSGTPGPQPPQLAPPTQLAQPTQPAPPTGSEERDQPG
ncbi:MAG: DivIVA domain-containing protein [Actinomycetota bacterium]|nr:DivIVA domain-containing protein [Actinomycetota bacterium]